MIPSKFDFFAEKQSVCCFNFNKVIRMIPRANQEENVNSDRVKNQTIKEH